MSWGRKEEGSITILFLWEMPPALRSIILAFGIDLKCLGGSVSDVQQLGGCETGQVLSLQVCSPAHCLSLAGGMAAQNHFWFVLPVRVC